MRLGEELKRTEEIEQPREPLGNRQFGEHSTQAENDPNRPPHTSQATKTAEFQR